MTVEWVGNFAVAVACILVVLALAVCTFAMMEQSRADRLAREAGQSPRQADQLARMNAQNPLGKMDKHEFQAALDARAEYWTHGRRRFAVVKDRL